jgi:hypothetical protein
MICTVSFSVGDSQVLPPFVVDGASLVGSAGDLRGADSIPAQSVPSTGSHPRAVGMRYRGRAGGNHCPSRLGPPPGEMGRPPVAVRSGRNVLTLSA